METKSYQNLLEDVAKTTVWGGCECPICKATFPTFLPSNRRQNARCPRCRSLERHRELWFVMHRMNWHCMGMRVLHFAPERIFYRIFSSLKDIDYWPVDLNPQMPGIRKVVDITNITFEDDSFDLIMCTHVLEHIPDDEKAMSELYRVLKLKTGIAFLNVPLYNIPVTFENPEYDTPELRLKYFGQIDHVRKYGDDYPKRLMDVGFDVQLFTADGTDENILNRYGFRRRGKTFVCRKK